MEEGNSRLIFALSHWFVTHHTTPEVDCTIGIGALNAARSVLGTFEGSSLPLMTAACSGIISLGSLRAWGIEWRGYLSALR
jgi:hypothetical protein